MEDTRQPASSGHGARPDGPTAAELRRFALFAESDEATLERARRRMRVRVVETGREIIAQGVEDAGDVFFVLSGRVDVQVRSAEGAPVWFAELGSGEVFGEMQAIDGEARSTEVVAAEICRLAVIGRAAFVETVTGDPGLALRMMQILAGRLRRQDRRYLEKTAVDLAGRIGRELLRRSALVDGILVVAPAPGPSEIARAIGARRESVSRTLAAFVRAGVVRRERDRLVIPDSRALDAAEAD